MEDNFHTILSLLPSPDAPESYFTKEYFEGVLLMLMQQIPDFQNVLQIMLDNFQTAYHQLPPSGSGTEIEESSGKFLGHTINGLSWLQDLCVEHTDTSTEPDAKRVCF